MSENENENQNVTQGNGTAGWGWEPVPQGGEYDSDATAFVKLPQDMLDALGTGEPLAAPGHGYVPPPMIVPLGSASTDPTATGTWTMPVQWPEAAGSAPAPAPGAGSQSGATSGSSVGGPIPASIPIPASVAAAFAEAEPEPAGAPVTDPGATAEWRFPGAGQEPEGAAEAAAAATGQWAVPDVQGDFRPSALDGDWSQAPATLPGGAAAPWAYLTQQPAGDADPGVLPGTDDAAAAAATAHAAGRQLGGPGAGALGRGPRVLGGPGVGTPLPEGEPAHPAPHDIEAAHGPAGEQAEDVRAAEHGEYGEYAGHAEHAGHAEPVGYGPYAGQAEHAEHAGPAQGGSAQGGTDGHGFMAFGHAEPAAPAPSDVRATPDALGEAEEPAVAAAAGQPVAPGGLDLFGGVRAEAAPAAVTPGAEPAPESGDTDGRGFAGAGAVPGELPAGRTPGEDTADSAVELPDAGSGESVPAAVPTYEEEAAAEAVAHHEHPHASYVLRVNGADRPVTGAWIGESLLYVLRERLGLAGAKDGCSQGECGACAVQVDGRLVASCLVPAATAAGSEVRTVEGLATGGELSDVQQALCRSGAVQCGFCVPGMAMTIHDLLEGNHAPSELETRQALCGNLCRCSGYAGVIGAVREVVAERGAAAAEPAASPEPRIPHQAAPGEGGIHHGGTA
ncbi:2Fe-2S iron-sulfur cluster-binding protein [Streptomyces sp. NPDC054787]